MEHSFNIEYAQKYGLEEAILIGNMRHWITKNKANRKHIYDGRTWTYNSHKAFVEIYPYWNEHKIRRILDSLVEQGVLVKGNYNKMSYDRTTWYAFNDESLFLQNSQIELADLPNGSDEIARPIPVINTIINTNKLNNKFIKPTKNQVEEYAKEISFSIDPTSFIDHYESNGWLVGKNPMKDWKAALRTWKRNQGKFNNNQPVNQTAKISLK